MSFENLSDWLDYFENRSPESHMKLGLERMQHAIKALALCFKDKTVITVAGTNGKGSTVATLQSLLTHHGERVGAFFSPHLVKLNERFQINQKMVSDKQLVSAFKATHSVAEKYGLSYFEWLALIAFWLFDQAEVRYLVMEVGLGGRLDAVNAVDADIAIITNIDFDHTELLGDSREAIATEKAGILRFEQQVFCGDPFMPQVIQDISEQLSAQLSCIHKDFNYQLNTDGTWQFKDAQHHFTELYQSELHLNNVTTALACFLRLGIATDQASINQSLKHIKIIGRSQYITGQPNMLLDVAHNTQSLKRLRDNLAMLNKPCHMVFSILKNKPVDDAIQMLKPYVTKWFIAPVQTERTIEKKEWQQLINKYQLPAKIFDSIELAYLCASSQISNDELLVICGSFHTVGEVIASKNTFNLINSLSEFGTMESTIT